MNVREELILRCAEARREKIGQMSDAAFNELLLTVRENPDAFIERDAEKAFSALGAALRRFDESVRNDDLLDDDQYVEERERRFSALRKACDKALAIDPGCLDARLVRALAATPGPDELLDALCALEEGWTRAARATQAASHSASFAGAVCSTDRGSASVRPSREPARTAPAGRPRATPPSPFSPSARRTATRSERATPRRSHTRGSRTRRAQRPGRALFSGEHLGQPGTLPASVQARPDAGGARGAARLREPLRRGGLRAAAAHLCGGVPARPAGLSGGQLRGGALRRSRGGGHHRRHARLRVLVRGQDWFRADAMAFAEKRDLDW